MNNSKKNHIEKNIANNQKYFNNNSKKTEKIKNNLMTNSNILPKNKHKNERDATK